MKTLIYVFFITAIVFHSIANATSGRTNASGCHNSKKAGYHCHGTSNSQVVAIPKVKNDKHNASHLLNLPTTQSPTPNTTEKANAKNKSLSFDVIYIIQNYLSKLGYYSGSITGDFNSETKQAIEKYQSDKNLTVNGEPSLDLMDMLAATVSALGH